MIFVRNAKNPIIARTDIPDVPPEIVDVTSVFNPGAVMLDGCHVLLLRVQTRARETRFMVARSDDGETFRIEPRVVPVNGLPRTYGTVHHIYDPRITAIGDDVIVILAMDTDRGCRLGVARTSNLETLELIGVASEDDSRNGVLFPERVGGRYLMLDRPNTEVGERRPPSGREIRLSESDDLTSWRVVGPVMSGRPRRWDERIGSGPPPVKTRAGWLHVYHGVATHFESVNVYQAGAVVLDLEDPSRVVARTRGNILEPRELCELVGQVPNVVFPSGLVVEGRREAGFAEARGTVSLYYGAADTSVCVATSTVERLIAACDG